MSSPTNMRERFEKLWKRIESTRTGHVSGRAIWNVDTEDAEGDSYKFIDETLLAFIESELSAQEVRVRERQRKLDKEVRMLPTYFCDEHLDHENGGRLALVSTEDVLELLSPQPGDSKTLQ